MPIPIRKTIPTDVSGLSIQLTDDGSRTLVREDSGDAYHSGCGALAETKHVYLDNSGVSARLQRGKPTSVLEIGLGTGMGLLLTVDAATKSSTSLRYDAFEIDWVPASVLRDLHLGVGIDDAKLAERFVAFRSSLASDIADGVYRWDDLPCDDAFEVIVDIYVADVRSHPFAESNSYDAIYFDPFAPASNADVWTSSVLKKMCQVLAPTGRLVTYCCSRAVRDLMQQSGFIVERVAGPPGGKREVLIATKSHG
tara:strand:+ start:322047 stop:322805 length:759 start_codon:yes stop_codon:yes gene_type:complete